MTFGKKCVNKLKREGFKENCCFFPMRLVNCEKNVIWNGVLLKKWYQETISESSVTDLSTLILLPLTCQCM